MGRVQGIFMILHYLFWLEAILNNIYQDKSDVKKVDEKVQDLW